MLSVSKLKRLKTTQKKKMKLKFKLQEALTRPQHPHTIVGTSMPGVLAKGCRQTPGSSHWLH